MLDIYDVVTLDDDFEYLVINIIKLNDVDYVFLVKKDDYNDFKVLEMIINCGEITLREVKDENVLKKLNLTLMRKSLEKLKKMNGGN